MPAPTLDFKIAFLTRILREQRSPRLNVLDLGTRV
jgi:hypothetical protein